MGTTIEKRNDGGLVLVKLINGNLVDSYSESNLNINFSIYAGSSIAIGQTFTNVDAGTLFACKFYMRKSGSPTGNCYAKFYNHTGTYGTNGTPVGTPIAISDVLDVSTLTTSNQLKTFIFSGSNRISLSASTYYCVEIYYNGGDVLNAITIGGDTSTPTHSGNGFYTTTGSSWFFSANDTIFYVYSINTTGDEGAIIYDSINKKIEYYNGTNWVETG